MAQDGRLLLRSVIADAVQYELAWGEEKGQRCSLPLLLGAAPTDAPASPWQAVDAQCAQ
ncbi:hypothetical protein D3C72_2557280 [compost metagenome]